MFADELLISIYSYSSPGTRISMNKAFGWNYYKMNPYFDYSFTLFHSFSKILNPVKWYDLVINRPVSLPPRIGTYIYDFTLEPKRIPSVFISFKKIET